MAGEMPTDTPAPTAIPQREQSIRVPVLRALAFGAMQGASPRIRASPGVRAASSCGPVPFRSRPCQWRARAERADMTATGVTGRGPALPGRVARSLRGAGLSGAALAGAGAGGALVSLRAAYPRPPRAGPPQGCPPPRPVPQGRLTVAVVPGASGSVITDAPGPYEVFA